MEFITLANKDTQKIIQDVILHPYKVNEDPSGVLVETLRKDWNDIFSEKKGFFMQYYSETPPNLARDENVWHFHPTTQDDRFSVVKGQVVVAVADNREDSTTKGLLNLFYIDARENPYMVLIPKKTLHGFMTVSKEPAILINFPTGLYNTAEEGRISYEEAKVLTQDGNMFSWDLVRKQFPNLSS